MCVSASNPKSTPPANTANPFHSAIRANLQKPAPQKHPDSSFENFTEEEGSEEEVLDEAQNPKIERLVDIIQRSQKSMPLRCEIDQTGYLKFKDTGTYIFDKDGNLFEFRREELREAVDRGVIQL